MNNYLETQARQDVKKKLTACYVLTEQAKTRILGYYTLTNNSIPLQSFPESIRKKLPVAYVYVPTILLGMLAVDKKHQAKGLEKTLLIDALRRSCELTEKRDLFAVFVDPIDHDAERFYEKYDFIRLPDSGKMFIPIKTLKMLFDYQLSSYPIPHSK